MSHVVIAKWSDERNEEERTCVAECECGWRSARASSWAQLRVPVLVHRLANADDVAEALAVGVSTLMDAAAPVVRCDQCGRSQMVRAMGYPHGLTGQQLIDIGWEVGSKTRGRWVRRTSAWYFEPDRLQESAAVWHCPVCR